MKVMPHHEIVRLSDDIAARRFARPQGLLEAAKAST